MSSLAQVTTGKIKKPHLILIHGIDGCGKTTWASQAPSPIFICSEDGTNSLDVARFPVPQSWGDALRYMTDLTKGGHQYKTLVIDTIDWLEPLLHQAVCKRHGVDSIELAAGGYGKGYVEAVNTWKEDFLPLVQNLRNIGMNIIAIAHSTIVKFNDPSASVEYDRYELKLYKKTAAMFREFVDTVLFASYEVYPKKEGGKIRAYGDGARVLYTERRPGFDAKNRVGLPFSLPLVWEDFDAAFQKNEITPQAIKESIVAMIPEIQDADLKAKVIDYIEKAGDDVIQLTKIKTRLLTRLGG